MAVCRRNLRISAWAALMVLMVLSLGLQRVVHAAEPSVPGDSAVQVVSVTGRAVFAPDGNTLMRYGGNHQLDRPEIQLKPGQWLHVGNAVLARENASVVLRWRDGKEQQIGPQKTMTSIIISPPHVVPAATLKAPVAAFSETQYRLQLLLAFERRHRPQSLFVLGVLLVVVPLVRRKTYQPGIPARFVAGALFIAVTLSVSLRLITLQLGRMAWYQPPLPGTAWTGAAASLAHAANVAAFFVVAAGVLALWVLSISFISGGSARLMRRSWAWWAICFAAILTVVASFLVPYAPNVDFESEWYHFWRGWARYYSVGAWLLLPVAQLVACARPSVEQGKRTLPWQGAAAGGLLTLFLVCYSLGNDAEYDASTGTRVEPASRAEHRLLLCAAQNIFVGTASNFHVINEPGCTPSQPRPSGDTSGVLQRCEIAEVSVHIDEVLRSPSLLPGQTITFQIAHARVPLDGADGLQQGLEGKHLFHTREENVNGRIVHIGATPPGTNRGSPLNFNHAGDADYERGLLPECRQ